MCVFLDFHLLLLYFCLFIVAGCFIFCTVPPNTTDSSITYDSCSSRAGQWIEQVYPPRDPVFVVSEPN